MISPIIRTQSEDFDINGEIAALKASNKNIGAVATFTGLCRDEEGRLSALELEHYPGMAEKQIREVCEIAIERFSLDGLSVIHRYGKIEPGQNIVLVNSASRHRQAAFDGANFVMDFLKTSAPFWKKEHLKDGSEGDWVSARDCDDNALEKWSRD